jgi:dUTP pyrophosphatase
MTKPKKSLNEMAVETFKNLMALPDEEFHRRMNEAKQSDLYPIFFNIFSGGRELMKVRVKKIDPTIETVIPKYAKNGDAGLDFIATSHEFEQGPDGVKLQVYGTNLAIEIPEGFVGLMFPRSSVSKTNLKLANSVGVVDSGYRGEIKMKFKIDGGARPTNEGTYKIGDRIAQMIIVPYPHIELELADDLSTSERGTGGWGSSGN